MFLFGWLLAIVYGLFYNIDISLQYNISIFIIPILAIISIVSITYRFIRLLVKSDRLENEFTTIVNHIFRTPLTRIAWIANELKAELPYEDRQAYTKDIENATSRLLSIVDTIFGIKDIHNKSSYVFKAVSIREIVETSLLKHSTLINQKNINLKVSMFEKMPLLTADLKKVSFVIDVLIENAVMYTQTGGNIVIDCKTEGNKMIFFVADNGIGMNIFERMNIFNKFYRGKKAKSINPDGMGLGLYLSKIIIGRHHGRIYAKSSGMDSGSVFYIELPLNR